MRRSSGTRATNDITATKRSWDLGAEHFLLSYLHSDVVTEPNFSKQRKWEGKEKKGPVSGSKRQQTGMWLVSLVVSQHSAHGEDGAKTGSGGREWAWQRAPMIRRPLHRTAPGQGEIRATSAGPLCRSGPSVSRTRSRRKTTLRTEKTDSEMSPRGF